MAKHFQLPPFQIVSPQKGFGSVEVDENLIVYMILERGNHPRLILVEPFTY